MELLGYLDNFSILEKYFFLKISYECYFFLNVEGHELLSRALNLFYKHNKK
jgi:hypothetical protein